MQANPDKAQYAGFWDRALAFVLDNILLALLLAPVVWLFVRADLQPADLADPFALAEKLSASLSSPLSTAVQFVVAAAYCFLFWKFRSATPGKILVGMSIVDAETGGKLPDRRLALRYLGYYLCFLTCLLGFIWIVFDKRKQGLHDKLAGSVVIMDPPPTPPVQP